MRCIDSSLVSSVARCLPSRRSRARLQSYLEASASGFVWCLPTPPLTPPAMTHGNRPSRARGTRGRPDRTASQSRHPSRFHHRARVLLREPQERDSAKPRARRRQQRPPADDVRPAAQPLGAPAAVPPREHDRPLAPGALSPLPRSTHTEPSGRVSDSPDFEAPWTLASHMSPIGVARDANNRSLEDDPTFIALTPDQRRTFADVLALDRPARRPSRPSRRITSHPTNRSHGSSSRRRERRLGSDTSRSTAIFRRIIGLGSAKDLRHCDPTHSGLGHTLGLGWVGGAGS